MDVYTQEAPHVVHEMNRLHSLRGASEHIVHLVEYFGCPLETLDSPGGWKYFSVNEYFTQTLADHCGVTNKLAKDRTAVSARAALNRALNEGSEGGRLGAADPDDGFGGDVVHQFWLWVLQATRGLDVLHSFGVVHRNLKASTCYIDRNGVVKIGNMLVFKTSPARIGKLGAPVDTWGGAPRTLSNPNIAVQSRQVLPPEHVIGSSTIVKAYGPECDMWALGCMVYHLLTGTQLNVALSGWGGAAQLEAMMRHVPLRFWKWARPVLTMTLTASPSKRAKPMDVLQALAEGTVAHATVALRDTKRRVDERKLRATQLRFMVHGRAGQHEEKEPGKAI